MSKSNGSGWRYRCKSCNFEVGIDKAFPKTCPGCHAGGWWGQLVTPDITQNIDGVKKDGVDSKNSDVKVPEGIMGRKGILSQQDNAVVCAEAQNKGVYETSPGQCRGRPLQKVPVDLIKQLDIEGFSSRAMVSELDQRGFKVSYKTIQRRLQDKGSRAEVGGEDKSGEIHVKRRVILHQYLGKVTP